MHSRIALIGFGEAAATFATSARWPCRAYDIAPDRAQAMADAGVERCETAAGALQDAQIVLSLVTADAALGAAQEYAAHLPTGAIWCDMNSVAPDTKREAAHAVESAGARYADVAILAPVIPAGLGVPLLVSGDGPDDVAERLKQAGFTDVRAIGTDVGQASAVKMIRSVMVKGLEALTDEMMEAAEAAGVTGEVLASLDRSEKADAWADRAAYNLARMNAHGARRAAEMEQVAKTLCALGVEPRMTNATVVRQRNAAMAKPTDRGAA